MKLFNVRTKFLTLHSYSLQRFFVHYHVTKHLGGISNWLLDSYTWEGTSSYLQKFPPYLIISFNSAKFQHLLELNAARFIEYFAAKLWIYPKSIQCIQSNQSTSCPIFASLSHHLLWQSLKFHLFWASLCANRKIHISRIYQFILSLE